MQTRRLSETWKINGKPIYAPDPDTSISRTKLADENSGRSDDGMMHINYIRTGMHKVEIKYSALSAEEWKYMLDLLDESPEEMALTYLDPQNGVSTIRCYSGDDAGSLYSSVLYGGLYRNCTFNCIEL